MDKTAKSPPEPPKPRKPYRTPVLSQYGDVRHLTSGGGGPATDAGGAMTKMNCWIAEALYGVDSPRVVLVRAWLKRCFDRHDGWALAAVPLYTLVGERVAAAIRLFPVLERGFRPLFDLAVRQAHGEYSARALARRSKA